MTVGSIATAQIEKAEIIATGLTCSMCSNAINKQLKSLSQVDSVQTDLNTNTFTVYLKKDNDVKPRLLKESVEKAGFFVGSMVVTMPFDNVKVDDNQLITKGDATLVFVDTKSKTLSGSTKVKVLDKGFVTQKEYKRLIKSYSRYPTYGTENENDYHVKAL
jgi:copper chaperone CopZ